MINIRKPYLIVPKLIHQPTWGGKYIVTTKDLGRLTFLTNYSIGQSYELFSGTKLLTEITDSTDTKFCPEVGFADTANIVAEHFNLVNNRDYINLFDLTIGNELPVLGGDIYGRFGKMPLLIKVTQAKGNSYQLHVKQNVEDDRWRAKPESWYYLEPGLLTCGIRNGALVDDYEDMCRRVDKQMHEISTRIKSGELDIDGGRQVARDYIQKNNPSIFVNIVEADKYDVYDMSTGGLHHSWEEDESRFPQGNILYEIQQDQMDPVSTLRSFDQGKIKDDGSIREVTIDDYFKYLDVSPETNDISRIKKNVVGDTVLSTPYYAMDVMKIGDRQKLSASSSFVHFYVREGDVTVETSDGSVRITKGYSCFVSQIASDVLIRSNIPNSVILKTYIPSLL